MNTPPEQPHSAPDPAPAGPLPRRRRIAVALLGLLPAAVITGVGNEIGHRLTIHALDVVRALVE
ncbi:hypothetical protein [Streptomyces sp. SID3343]|uniref:hypothetical protein n=1 Tax=Streptomyces sp. SID3343 TaxID=2690260 RepID=UPI0013682E6C|nr:hypothetical protein [Streptomyces sp. SID3343]MYW04151.1 hypothetical protein [Streptomyces sp. SID3343]